MKNNFFKEYFKPIVVLVLMCAIVAVSLAATNYITAPLIADNRAKEAEESRAALLPNATGFEQVPVDVENVRDAYKDTGGSGYVVTSVVKGYGGDVTVMVGFTPDGIISGISADVSKETPGLGNKAGRPAFLDQFIGMGDGEIKVDAISGATYSSQAVQNGVIAAVAAFDQITGEVA